MRSGKTRTVYRSEKAEQFKYSSFRLFARLESASCVVAGHSSLSFSGNSYIKYRLYDLLPSEMKVSLRIRTLQSQGIIMFTQTDPCMVLKVGTHGVTIQSLLVISFV